MPDLGGVGKISNHYIGVFEVAYMVLEKNRRAALGPGQLKAVGQCRRSGFVRSH